MTLPDFWNTTTALPRAGMVLAVISAVTVTGATFGLGMAAPLAAWITIHMAVMALILMLVRRNVQYRRLTGRLFGGPMDAVQVPRWLRALTLSAFIAMLILFFLDWRSFGEGGAEFRDGRYFWAIGGVPVRDITQGEYQAFNSALLRVFAGAWLFFSLYVTWAGHVVAVRIARFRESELPAA